MFKGIIKFIALSFITTTMLTAADFNVDKEMSKVEWHAEKVTGKHDGFVSVKSGYINVDKTMLKNGEFVIDMKSISNKDIEDAGYKAKLENHLKSEDFFSVEKFPEAKFVITKVVKKGKMQNVTGNMTIKGITHKMTFPAEVTVSQDALTAIATVKIDRSKFNVQYNSKSFFDVEALGDKMIYDEFTINLHLVAKK